MAQVGFQAFSAQHIAAILLTLILPIGLAWIVRRSSRPRLGITIARFLAAALLLNEAASWGVRLAEAGLAGFARYHLPLHVCGIALFATVATLLWKSRRAYEIAYFWGLVGASNAVITPGGLYAGFPEYRFFQYFIAHSGIVVGCLFATWGLGLRPTLAGLIRAFAALNLFAAAVALINLVLGSNYMYLSAPPDGTLSPFFIGPWPWYIVFLEFVALAMFLAVYAPFALAERESARQEPKR